ncbi:hypothetical protein H7I76_00030, partial [Mycolicibacterium vaccae]|nr:hypothetical protein [Mycolicibacterium vaccae]
MTMAIRPLWSGMSACDHLRLEPMAPNHTDTVSTTSGGILNAVHDGMTMAEPANPPSRNAPLLWAVGGAIPWLVVAAAQLLWFLVDSRLLWLHGCVRGGDRGRHGDRRFRGAVLAVSGAPLGDRAKACTPAPVG